MFHPEHSCEGKIYVTDAHTDVNDITDCFCSNRCPTLARKPKMFFIQGHDECVNHTVDASSEDILINFLTEANIFVTNARTL
ncbi:hypothetical protein ACTXT7_004169 [Hymenolepis weldensis]